MNFVIEERGIDFAVTIEVQDIPTGRQYHSDLGLYASGSSDPCIQWHRGAPALSVIELDVYMSLCSRVCVSVSADYNLL